MAAQPFPTSMGPGVEQLRRFLRSVHAWMTESGSEALEGPISLDKLRLDRVSSSLPSFSFFLLLLTSTMIATLGLIANSTAVVIGAMIVAPLMNPILSLSFGTVSADWELIRHSLIAIAAGIAGAFSLTRKSVASSIAGVAIAVALVPPLCVTGIGMALGSDVGSSVGAAATGGLGGKAAAGSFLLFLANLIGIDLAASMTFLSQNYGSLRRSWYWIALAFLSTCLISGPLSGALREFLMTKWVDIEISRIGSRQPQI